MSSGAKDGEIVKVVSVDFQDEHPGADSNSDDVADLPGSTAPLGVLSSVASMREGEPIAVEQVPQLLKDEGLEVTIDEVLEALQAVRITEGSPEGTYDCAVLSRREIALVLNYLTCRAGSPQGPLFPEKNTPAELPATRTHGGVANTLGSALARLCHYFRRGRTNIQVYDQGIKPSNRLLLIVVLLSLVMALTVAGTAIGLIWVNATEAKKSALTENLNMIKNAVEFFSVTQAFQRQADAQADTAFIVANILSEVGYKQNLNTVGQGQVNAAQVTGLLTQNVYQRNLQATAMS
eukprot:RCo003448